MEVAEVDLSLCPAYIAINLLQEKWTLHIVRNLLGSPKGFNELSRSVGGCNPATLALRVEKLVEMKVVEKKIISTMPPKVSYQLSESGRALQAVIESIDTWGRTYL
jgi:DNA-binding HxlR family transcriptional regulator